MTNKELDKNRLEIVQSYLKSAQKLDLTLELSISVYSSTPGIYHVFLNNKTHAYSMGDVGLKNLAKSLNIEKIKKIFIATKVVNITRNMGHEINPMDFENCS